jgi:hypothetical protein
MPAETKDPINKPYIIGVSVITFVLPVLSLATERWAAHSSIVFSLSGVGKWFIFYAAGIRLFLAGIRQATKPAFTAKVIFHMESTESYPIIRELGFANLCFGLIALISLFLPGWRVVSAFGSGLYYGLAGIMHAVKKPVGINEKFALYTDFIIFMGLAVEFVRLV